MQMEAFYELALRLWYDYEWALSIAGLFMQLLFSNQTISKLPRNLGLRTVA